MPKIRLLIVLIISCNNSYAQVNIDSLRRIWNDSTQLDTVRLNAIYEISTDVYYTSRPDSALLLVKRGYSYAKKRGLKKSKARFLSTMGKIFFKRGDYDSAIYNFNRSLSLNEEINNETGVSASHNNLGIVYTNQGNYHEAIKHLSYSLEIKKELKNKLGIAQTSNNIGRIHFLQADYTNAINHYTSSLKLFEELGIKKSVGIVLNNIGVVYKKLEDYDHALDYYKRSLNISKELGSEVSIARTLNNIGGIYFEQEEYDSTFKFISHSLTIFEKIGRKKEIAESLGNIGLIQNKKGKYDDALSYFTRAQAINEELENKYGLTNEFINIGDTYFLKKDFSSAIQYGRRALSLAKETGAISHTKMAAESLYKSYKAIDKYRQALKMYELYTISKDSIDNIDRQREIIRKEYKYEYEKKSSIDSLMFVEHQAIRDLTISEQNAEIKSTRYFALLLASVLILGIILITILYRGYKRKIEDHQLIAKQKQSLEQVNIELIEKNNEIETQADRIIEANQKIHVINESLERKVKERTAKVQSQNETLRSHAFSVSHTMRAPLARLIGLINLKESVQCKSNEEEKLIIASILSSADELDEIIKSTSELLNKEEMNK